MEIYRYLKLDQLDCCVAIIKNARSDKMGKKDIIKVECSPEMLDLDVLGFIDHSITVNIVRDGKITRTAKIRVIREGIVIYTGVLGSLKRFKDDVKEVTKGFECGLNIENYNDIRVGDMIEGYQEVEVKKTL